MSIRDHLFEIKKHAHSLNLKTDELNATIEGVEKELAGCGVEFWDYDAPIASTKRRDAAGSLVETYHVLGYGRSPTGSEWVIMLQKMHAVCVNRETEDWEEEEVDHPIVLRRAARQLRVGASAALEKFLASLAREVAKMEETVGSANASLAGEG